MPAAFRVIDVSEMAVLGVYSSNNCKQLQLHYAGNIIMQAIYWSSCLTWLCVRYMDCRLPFLYMSSVSILHCLWTSGKAFQCKWTNRLRRQSNCQWSRCTYMYGTLLEFDCFLICLCHHFIIDAFKVNFNFENWDNGGLAIGPDWRSELFHWDTLRSQ